MKDQTGVRGTAGPLATALAIKNLPAKGERYDKPIASEDDDGRALPGLQIRVFPSGARTFRYRYQLDGAVRAMTLGPFPEVSLTLARERHRAAYKLLQRDIDPVEHEAEQARKAAERRAHDAKAITVAKLVDEFVANELRERRKDPDQAERMLRKDVVKRWGTKLVRDITRQDGKQLIRAVKSRAPIVANRVKALLEQLFDYAAEEGHIGDSPLRKMRRVTKEVPRDRALSVDEIKTLWHELDARTSSQPFGTLKKGREDKRGTKAEPFMSKPVALAVKLLLVTGQRRGELAKALKNAIDLDAKLWAIPAEHSKNGNPHAVPLSPLACQLFRDAMALTDSTFVFGSPRKKARADSPITEKAVTRAVARNQCGLEHWTAHDLRRTAASHLHRIGVDPIVVERVLNHTLPKMMQTYNRHDYADEMRVALDRWAAELERIIAGESNVVALPRARA